MSIVLSEPPIDHDLRTPASDPWPFYKMDSIQTRNHLASQVAVQRSAQQAQDARLAAALASWRQQP